MSDLVGVTRQVEAELVAADHRAVHNLSANLGEQCSDPLAAGGGDRIPFYVQPTEAVVADRAGHVLRDCRRAEADDDVALGDQPSERSDILKASRRGSL